MKTATVEIFSPSIEGTQEFDQPNNITVFQRKDPVDEYFDGLVKLAVLEKNPETDQQTLLRLQARVERMRASVGHLFGDPFKTSEALHHSLREYRVPSRGFEAETE